MEATMKATTTTMRTIDLGYEQVFVLDGGRDTRVRVLFGGTWLTEEDASGDAIVCAGEEVALRRDGHAVLEGLGPTRLQIIEPARRPLQRAARWRQHVGRYLRQTVERLHLGARAAAEPNG
jgi:hypothetical protein